ncbi:MAG TPA: efflux RND transporter periplasmic adaptor subunit [Alphaproteobacteria bacterium]
MRVNASQRLHTILTILLLLGCAGAIAFFAGKREPSAAAITGLVRVTEIRVAPEVSGRLTRFQVAQGAEVRKGDTLAVLENPELAAAVEEAKAVAAEAKAARDRVYAGVRKERVDISAQEVQKAEANLSFARQEHERYATLAARGFETRQRLDEATAALDRAEADLAQSRSRYAEAKAGATTEELAIADAKVARAEAAVGVLEARLAKTRILAPVDGAVRLLVAEPGESVLPGDPVLTLEAKNERWLSFTVREDRLGGIDIGKKLTLEADGGKRIAAQVTELRPLGEFATWRAARAVGDHDLNSFFLRADPVDIGNALEPGMTIWLETSRTNAK